jgi:hypothetical protein
MGAQPEDVGGDAGEFGHDHPDVLSPLGHLDAEQLFHRQAEAEVIHLTGQIIHPVHEGQALVVGAVFAQLLNAAVEIADIRFSPDHDLAVQLHQHPENTVGAGVLGAHVQDHDFRLGDGFNLFH